MVTIGYGYILGMTTSGIFQEFHATIVPVSNVEKSAGWYREKLGLLPRREMPGMVVFGLGGTAHLCLFESSSAAGDGKSGVFPNFRSSDLEATRKLLLERGVECSEIQAMPELRFMTCHDPDDNRIDVCEYGPNWLE